MAPPTIAKLADDNYAEWVIGMEALLVRKGLWEVTSAPADETRPSGSDNTKAVRAWRAKIAEARAEIILNIEPTQYAHIQSQDVHEVWTELCRVHRARGFGTRVAHRRAFWRLMKRPEQTMTSWIADVRRAAFRLEEIDASISDEDRILVLTNGLPDSYSQLVVNLDSTPPSELTIDYVITRLLNEESRQLSLNQPHHDSEVALAAYTKPRTPLERITCFKCSKKGHYQRDCPELKTEEAHYAFSATVSADQLPAEKETEAW